jgi:hypothetical protein
VTLGVFRYLQIVFDVNVVGVENHYSQIGKMIDEPPKMVIEAVCFPFELSYLLERHRFKYGKLF